MSCRPPHIRSTYPRTLYGFAEILQAEPRHHSEDIGVFYDDDPEGAVAVEFDLNTVTPAMIRSARNQIRRVTQQSLRYRRLPSRFAVWRYGPLQRFKNAPITSVTLDPGVAARGAKRRGDPIFECEVDRSAVVADVPAVLLTDLLEEELLVRPEDLVCRRISLRQAFHKGRAFCAYQRKQKRKRRRR